MAGPYGKEIVDREIQDPSDGCNRGLRTEVLIGGKQERLLELIALERIARD